VEIPGLSLDMDLVQTNIILVTVEKGNAGKVQDELREEGLKVSNLGDGRLRLVTHHGVGQADVEAAAKIIRDVMRRQS